MTKIEWATVDVIVSLKFHFNNGTCSPQLGQRVALKQSHEFEEFQDIKKIFICVRKNLDYLETMVLVDQNE